MKSFIIAMAILVGMGILLHPAEAQASVNARTCEQVEIPVALHPGQAKNHTIAGTHCVPNTQTNPNTVDMLVPGGTYDSLYWDFPAQDYEYSYVDRTLNAGRATFNLDRIGTGESSKPFSALITLDVETYTLHQVVDWLRSDLGYDDITAIGHSMGSVMVTEETAKYNDVDRVVATGFMHAASLNMIFTVGTLFYPAALDPQFASLGLDPGYVTTIPGRRTSAFYYSSANPSLTAYDEAHKDIMSLTSIGVSIPKAALLPPPLNSARKITVPVVTVVGQHDVQCKENLIIGVDCSSAETVKANESKYYTQASSYNARVIPNTGHNLPLHPSHEQSFSEIDEWIKTH